MNFLTVHYSLAISIRSNPTHESTTTSASLDGLGVGLARLDGIRLPGADCGIAYQTIPNAHRILYDRVAAIQSLSIVPWSKSVNEMSNGMSLNTRPLLLEIQIVRLGIKNIVVTRLHWVWIW